MLIAFCLLAVLALAAACGGGEEEEPGGGELPEGFPQDFPLYQNAVVDVATVAPDGEGFRVQLSSSDSPDQVRDFYEQELDKDPWHVENVQDIPEMATTVIAFARVDSGEEWGTVAIVTVQENGRRVNIAVSLTAVQ